MHLILTEGAPLPPPPSPPVHTMAITRESICPRCVFPPPTPSPIGRGTSGSDSVLSRSGFYSISFLPSSPRGRVSPSNCHNEQMRCCRQRGELLTPLHQEKALSESVVGCSQELPAFQKGIMLLHCRCCSFQVHFLYSHVIIRQWICSEITPTA